MNKYCSVIRDEEDVGGKVRGEVVVYRREERLVFVDMVIKFDMVKKDYEVLREKYHCKGFEEKVFGV